MTDKIRRIVFAHDGRFVWRQGQVYSMASFPAVVWQRYLANADELVVVARDASDAADADSALALSDSPGVRFCLMKASGNGFSVMKALGGVSREVVTAVEQADAVIVRLPSGIGMMAQRVAHSCRKPVAIELVACVWDSLWNHGRIAGKLYAPLAMMRTRRVVRDGRHVMYVTQEFLQARYPNHGGHVGVCSNVHIPSVSDDVLESRLTRIERNHSPIRLGLIGSLRTRYKGIQTVFAALASVRSKLPAVEFHVLGGGEQAPWMREATRLGVHDLVHFDGTRASGSDVFDWLDEVDIYLQPSLQEGLPRALIEAMSRGCPAIGSRRAGIPELLESECLIPPGDHSALAEKLVVVCNSKEWQRQQAKRNWHKAAEYTSEVLDSRRNKFWSQFRDDVLSNRCVSQ